MRRGQGGYPSAETTTQYQISAIQPTASSIYFTLPVEGTPTNFMADTGADITLLPKGHPAVVAHAA